tara:strand:+ start:1248 stop:1514 length:267 start_codon:yes stop_codon:yes gene_type:complete
MNSLIAEKNEKYIRVKRNISHLFSLFVIFIYFSFIFLVGFNPQLLAKEIENSSMTYGVAFGLSIIIFSIILTLIYTLISNKYIDEIKK